MIVVDQRPEDPLAEAKVMLDQSLAQNETMSRRLTMLSAMMAAILVVQAIMLYGVFDARELARQANHNAILATESAQKAEQTASDAFYETSSLVEGCDGYQVE